MDSYLRAVMMRMISARRSFAVTVDHLFSLALAEA
jgi:hypothetical protein